MFQPHILHHDIDWAMRAIMTHRAVLILDLAGRIAAVNQSCLDLCEYRREELLGRPIALLLDSAENSLLRLRQVLQSENIGDTRLPGLCQISKAGRRYRVDARLCPIRDDDAEVFLNVMFLRQSAEAMEGPAGLDAILRVGANVIQLPQQGAGQARRAALNWMPAMSDGHHNIV